MKKRIYALILILVFLLLILFLKKGVLTGKVISENDLDYKENLDECKDCNVVLIVIDSLRADHLPIYRYKKNTAPFLGEIADKGFVFENAYSTSSWTAPSTASIFTSLYPTQHGVVTGFLATDHLKENINSKIKLNKIPEEIETIGEMFKNEDYKTYAVTDNINVCKEEGFSQGFDKFQNYNYESAKTVNKQLMNWKDEIKNNGKYFLYIHYMDPHVPYHQRSPWFKQTRKESPEVSAYDSEINYVDDKIKEMFEAFEWGNNTLLIISADHGEEFLEHGGTGHSSTLYSEVLHIPLIIYFPEKLLKTKRIEDKVSNIDILPTLKEIINSSSTQHHEGISLIPLLKEESLESRHLFSHLLRKKGSIEEMSSKELEKDYDRIKKAVIYEDWKLISNIPGTEELYNLKKDPEEQKNRIKDYPEVANSLREKLEIFDNKKGFEKETLEVNLDEETLNKLQSLGYMN